MDCQKILLLKKIDELLKAVDIEKAANRSIRKYSKGMIQRIGFASAMIHEPEILILDEPMSGLDPMGRYVFKNMMKEINKKGTTIFFSSHIIPDMEDICDRVLVVKEGKMIKTLSKNEIKYFATIAYYIIVKSGNIELLKDYDFEKIEDSLFRIKTTKENLEKVLFDLKKLAVEIIDIDPIKKNLEDLFVEIVT
jgi:ABC-2 type transport system ATP-binding protein